MPGLYGPGTAPGALGKIWILLKAGGIFSAIGTSGPQIAVAIPLVPLVGVAAAGYSFGVVYRMPAVWRIARLQRWGGGLLAAFACLRALNAYGNPVSWKPEPTAMTTLASLLSVSRFPPSLHFVLFSLGLALLALAVVETQTRWARPLAVFGRTPLVSAEALRVHCGLSVLRTLDFPQES
jgi:uncharacterized membrane protein